MKKFVYTLALLLLVLSALAQKQRQKEVSPFSRVATFGWNIPNGLPYMQSFSGNYSVEVYRQAGQHKLVFLSRGKQTLSLFNTLTGTKEKTISLPFSPVDFAVSEGNYYVAGTQYLYLLDKDGNTKEKWYFGNSILFVDNVKVVDGRVYLLTSGQKSWWYNPAQKRFVMHDGLILGPNRYGKILKTGPHQFKVILFGKGEALFSRTFREEKALGTIRIIGLQNGLLFVEVQTILGTAPLKVQRTIKIYRWEDARLSAVSSVELPDIYYTYTKHDVTLSSGGLNVFISAPGKAALYRCSEVKKQLAKPRIQLPASLYKKSYLYNNHLLPAMESSGYRLKEAQLAPISRQKIIQNAEPYAPYKWYCHANNIWDRDCGGVHVRTPSWVTVGNNISVPYMWGGFSSLKQFDQGLANGVSAGDADTHGNGAGSSCAVGVDCSGFVSRAWGLGVKYSTRSIPDISTSYSSYDDLKPGDVVNYAGHHVRLIHTVNGNGSFLIIEAAGSSTDWRVGYNSYSVADFQGRYLPRRYIKVTEGKTDTIPPTTSILAGKWETGDFQVTFSDTDNVRVTRRFYHTGYYDGTQWTANSQNGFFKDRFHGTLASQWTTVSGTWHLTNGTLEQTDETSANTSIYASLVQNAAKYNFLYQWQMKIAGNGDNRRAGIIIMSDNPSATQRNNAYMIYFRADQNTCQIYKSVNNTISLKTSDACEVNAGEWFDAKVMYNAATGEIDVFKNNRLVSAWIDARPLTSGNSLSLRTGNARVSYKNITVFRSRGTSVEIGTGQTGDAPTANPWPGQPACRIFSVVADSMYNLSAVDSAWVNIDKTKPAAFQVFDGNTNGSDLDTTTDTTRIAAHWTASADPNSGIAHYFCCAGTTPGSNNLVDWFDNGKVTSFAKTGLSLQKGITWHVSVVAVNGAGLASDTVVSNGTTIEEPTGIVQKSPVNFRIYPVPAGRTLWIKPAGENLSGKPELYNLSGKRLPVQVTPLPNGGWKMELHRVRAGFYLIRLPTHQGTAWKKIAIKK